jgi:hypothetical protein
MTKYSLLLSLASLTIYSLEKTEKQMFQENLKKLSKPIIEFIEDFQTWPKIDQDKIALQSNSGGVSFTIKEKLDPTHKYDGCVYGWLTIKLLKPQTIPFFLAVDYIKKQPNFYFSEISSDSLTTSMEEFDNSSSETY